MKIVKMSLVAALVIGSSAFAIENTKVSGDAKLFYATDDAEFQNYTGATASGTSNGDMFSKENSAGQAALGLGITSDLTSGVSAGAHLTALTTLGLQGQLVTNVWEATNGVSDYYWFDEAWLAGTVGKTTAKVGRMELDTPMVFTEKWSVAKNTFEAAVLINQDLPDTTLVGAYVGGSNSNAAVNNSHGNGLGGGGFGAIVQNTTANGETNFSQFYNGAFAAGLINNSFKPLTFQAWYFDASSFVNAYWLQADIKCSLINGVLIGAQYTGTDYTKSTQLPIAKDASNSAFAAMLGYEMKDVATLTVAMSQTGTEKDSSLGLGAGGNLGGAQTKLYTEAWWMYGYVIRADTSAYKVSLESPVQGMFDLGLYYTASTTSSNGAANTPDVEMSEIAISASKSFGPLDASLVIMNVNADDVNVKAGNTTGDAFNMAQIYLTYNF